MNQKGEVALVVSGTITENFWGFPKGHVDAGEAAAYGSGDRSFEADVGAFERIEHVLRKHLAGLHDYFGRQLQALPIDHYACRINGSNGRIGHFGTNAITWD